MIFLMLSIAWAIAVLFYFLKIKRIADSNRVSVFAAPSRYSKAIRSLVKNLHFRILIATIIFILTVLVAFFVGLTSE